MADSSAPPGRRLRTPGGHSIRLPVFLPVYQETFASIARDEWERLGIEACILNAYFLYKRRDLREAFAAGRTLQEHIGFRGAIMTDSGAFQGFTRRLYLDNRTIVRFQDSIGADIVSPLDLVTPPGDPRGIAEKKMRATVKRVREALGVVRRAVLAGVQQGGRFRELRQKCTEALLELDVSYLALGSLVPFFARNHDLTFVRQVVEDVRAQAGPDLPVHIYGAGDPVELPFLARFGTDVFDSSSYAHYAVAGWYMTPYGAVRDPAGHAEDYACACAVCTSDGGPAAVVAHESRLRSHNLATILETMRAVRAAIDANRLDDLCSEILESHMRWFPDSRLEPSVATSRPRTSGTSG